MQHTRPVGRFALLALTLLSACAASGAGGPSGGKAAEQGTAGDFLAGRYALSRGDYAVASTNLLAAVRGGANDPEVMLDALIACVDAERPEAVMLARKLPDSQIAQLVLADAAIADGNWDGAVDHFSTLPRQGLTQAMQPLLVAWAQAGGGHTDAALNTLRPYLDNPRLQGLFALHAGLIADLGGKADEAGRFYGLAKADLTQPNLRLVQILASWQARSGQPAEAEHTLATLPAVAPDLSIVMPSLLATVLKPPVPNARDGVAEAYFTFAALLRAQEQNEFGLILLKLALALRPDFTTARVLAADILANQNHLPEALALLNQVPAGDPILPLVQLRKAVLINRMGQTDQAVQDLRELAQQFPDSPLPDEQLGDILRERQRFPAAVAAYDQAVARIGEPSAADWVLFYERGVAEEQSHQWPKAVEDFRHALQLSPDQPFVLNYLGYSWADQGTHLAEARKMIETAAQKRPNDGAITDSLGWVEYRQGDYRDAVRTLERAVELEPEDATINGHLGDAYWAVGRRIEAEYQWRRALTMHPTPDDAARLQAKLSPAHSGTVVSNP